LNVIGADPVCATALRHMVADILNGHVAKSVRERLTRCRLVAIPKPDDGVRPIAIGTSGSAWSQRAVSAGLKRGGKSLSFIFFIVLNFLVEYKGDFVFYEFFYWLFPGVAPPRDPPSRTSVAESPPVGWGPPSGSVLLFAVRFFPFVFSFEGFVAGGTAEHDIGSGWPEMWGSRESTFPKMVLLPCSLSLKLKSEGGEKEREETIKEESEEAEAIFFGKEKESIFLFCSKSRRLFFLASRSRMRYA